MNPLGRYQGVVELYSCIKALSTSATSLGMPSHLSEPTPPTDTSNLSRGSKPDMKYFILPSSPPGDFETGTALDEETTSHQNRTQYPTVLRISIGLNILFVIFISFTSIYSGTYTPKLETHCILS